MPETYQYGNDFFDYITRGARRSAASMVPLVSEKLKPLSVLDVGCGRGIWIDEWMRAGTVDCVGLDGEYIDMDRLVIPRDRFLSYDLSKEVYLDRTFDIVQSLEVAEHISLAFADIFVANLCRHGELILFSAAVPGQGGEMHVNEQPLEYWRQKFRAHGYSAYDWVRTAIRNFHQIEPWYRYNALLYVTEEASKRLPPDVRAARLPPNLPVPNVAPLSWRGRNALLRCLPATATHRLAVLKHRMLNAVTG